MIVAFSTSIGHMKVSKVIWEERPGFIVKRTMVSDGTVRDEACHHDSLRRAVAAQGLYSHSYFAEVPDIRVAFKYLGKAFDLVETLPSVELP